MTANIVKVTPQLCSAAIGTSPRTTKQVPTSEIVSRAGRVPRNGASSSNDQTYLPSACIPILMLNEASHKRPRKHGALTGDLAAAGLRECSSCFEIGGEEGNFTFTRAGHHAAAGLKRLKPSTQDLVQARDLSSLHPAIGSWMSSPLTKDIRTTHPGPASEYSPGGSSGSH